ncbi:hypothetical protein QG37_01143 [Candidozyma auris]|uniref:Uncharacterized protein n=1 Tax=Candidozyma auris TaxID=498019 RepID=A0A0L0P5Z6_CANAR|nr:hypothetical protein QG37_01143 [[Candida] auris]
MGRRSVEEYGGLYVSSLDPGKPWKVLIASIGPNPSSRMKMAANVMCTSGGRVLVTF